MKATLDERIVRHLRLTGAWEQAREQIEFDDAVRAHVQDGARHGAVAGVEGQLLPEQGCGELLVGGDEVGGPDVRHVGSSLRGVWWSGRSCRAGGPSDRGLAGLSP